MKKEFKCWADMGSMKILFKGGSCFFNNGIGDIDFKVSIADDKDLIDKNLDKTDFEFVGNFTSFGECWLMAYDCDIREDNKLYNFPEGRYFVFRDKKGNMQIEFCDDELKS